MRGVDEAGMLREPAVEGRDEAVPADVRRDKECARDNEEAVEGREEALPLRFGNRFMPPFGE